MKKSFELKGALTMVKAKTQHAAILARLSPLAKVTEREPSY